MNQGRFNRPDTGGNVIINNTNINQDGFNDPTPADPLVGNPATTLLAAGLNEEKVINSA